MKFYNKDLPAKSKILPIYLGSLKKYFGGFSNKKPLFM